jgi:hypothetical protein
MVKRICYCCVILACILWRIKSAHYFRLRETETRIDLALPHAAEFVLILLSRQRRNDVLNDMLDWYPCWVQEKGRFSANVLCSCRISAAVFAGLLDLTGRIAEIIGKFRGAK